MFENGALRKIFRYKMDEVGSVGYWNCITGSFVMQVCVFVCVHTHTHKYAPSRSFNGLNKTYRNKKAAILNTEDNIKMNLREICCEDG
jgi:hypothetical protein